ncbi:MAG: peptide ABC transporter substrate-binding protein [Chloroflexi bacterium]|nr:peptide ABC transporter substrate-binding protein [Chloroflexota bacterium]
MFRRIGWQVILVGIGFLVAATVLAYMATTYTTEFRPAPGGTYVESVGGYPQSLNPLLSFYNDADGDVVELIFTGLTQLNMRGEIEPDLAATWETDGEGITYTFRLNRNVVWHDGFPFSAKDVIFTTELLQDPDYPGPADIGALWRSVDVTAVDDYTVRFVLREPYAPFLDYTTIGILPRHRFEGVSAAELALSDFSREPIGTGPFRFVEMDLGDGHIASVTLKRFPRYYGRSSYIENIVLRFYPTPRAAFEAYQDGIVEGVARIPIDLMPEAFAEPDLRLFSAPTSEMAMIYLNELITDTLPFGDARIRQALYAGLDRQALADAVLMGQAVLPETPLLPGTWAYSLEGVPTYSYDQERALTLLAEAGWSRQATTDTLRDAQGAPLAFTLVAANDAQELAVARAVAQQWQGLGISVTVEAVPALALSGVLESRTYQAALARLMIPGDPDPYPFWHETQSLPGQGQNYAGFQNRRVSEVVEQARIAVSREERRTLYREFQQLFMEELPALPLYVPVYTYAVDVRVNGGQIGPLMRPADRFLTLTDWYVLQRRVVASQLQGATQ